MATSKKIFPDISEAEFQAQIVKLASLLGWRIYHTHDSRRSAPGFPDLVLVHKTKKSIVFAELKSPKGRLTPEQNDWLTDLAVACLCDDCRCGHVSVRIWRPSDWDDIQHTLQGD